MLTLPGFTWLGPIAAGQECHMLLFPQACVSRASSKGLLGDGFKVSIQWKDTGADQTGQRSHRPTSSTL